MKHKAEIKSELKSNPEISILLVEDDLIAQRFALAVIHQVAYFKVDVASSGAEARKLAATNHYDVILMDIGLGDSSGFAETEIIRQSEGPNKDTPIIALTSHNENAYHNQAEWVGMTDYMIKPLDKDKLENVINTHVHKPTEVIKLRLAM